MKDINMLVWLTQLGLGVALPLAGAIWLGVWLREKFMLGAWVVAVCAVLGLIWSGSSLHSSLKLMSSMNKKKDNAPPPVSFNDHE